MCRQETTVRFWGWKAVKKDRNQATERRPVSAGQYHLQLCSLHQVQGGLGAHGEGRSRTHKIQIAVMLHLPSLFPSPSDCGHISKH